MLLSLCFNTLVCSYMPFLIFTVMQTKKAVFYLEIQSTITGYKFKVSSLQNIYQQSVNMYNLNLAILAKNRCLQKTKMKIYLSKAVQELWFINGRILLIVIRYKQAYLKM